MKAFAKDMLRPAWKRVQARVESIVDRKCAALVEQLSEAERQLASSGVRIDALERELDATRHRLHLLSLREDEAAHRHFAPDPLTMATRSDAPFMAYANCQASDFYHPRFHQLSKLMAMRPHFHRKQWEWVYVLHQLLESGVLKPGARGLGFGVGTEPLPATFASVGAEVTATDAPMDVSRADAWQATRQHSDSVDQLLNPAIAPDDLVRSKVSHRSCDMNRIDPELSGYDFNWSSCCFEHLGSIELGLQFVLHAVEQTLKIGGVAVHTTEFNMSSNEATITEGDTVIFRLRDMEDLVSRLRARGHEVQPFVLGPPAHELDFHVDVPPYRQDAHLKLMIASFVATSVGIVVRRGA